MQNHTHRASWYWWAASLTLNLRPPALGKLFQGANCASSCEGRDSGMGPVLCDSNICSGDKKAYEAGPTNTRTHTQKHVTTRTTFEHANTRHKNTTARTRMQRHTETHYAPSHPQTHGHTGTRTHRHPAYTPTRPTGSHTHTPTLTCTRPHTQTSTRTGPHTPHTHIFIHPHRRAGSKLVHDIHGEQAFTSNHTQTETQTVTNIHKEFCFEAAHHAGRLPLVSDRASSIDELGYPGFYMCLSLENRS